MDVLFLVKKILGTLLMPMSFGFILLLLALFLFWRKRHRVAKGLVISVLFTAYALSIQPTAQLIAGPLEHQYPKYAKQPVSYIVVLGGYHNSDARFPVSSLLSRESLMRLSEGMRIYRLNPGAKLMLSGNKFYDEISNAEAMAEVARAYGIPGKDILIAKAPKDTGQEAQHWAKLLQKNKFALVTSALHMPRSVYLFQQQGLQPVPAPTAFRTGGHHGYHWHSWLPKAITLSLVESAWHEYLGLWWAKLRTAGSSLKLSSSIGK